MNNSPKLCTGSWLLLCVVHLVRDSCPWRSHKREVLALPARKHSSEQLCAPCSGTEGCFDSQRRQGSYCCLCMRVCIHACTHTYTAPPPQTNKKSSPSIWHEILIFILGIVFPSWVSFLVSFWNEFSIGRLFSPPLGWYSDSVSLLVWSWYEAGFILSIFGWNMWGIGEW